MVDVVDMVDVRSCRGVVSRWCVRVLAIAMVFVASCGDAPSLVSIACMPSQVELAVGQTAQLTAIATYSNGSTADFVNAGLEWRDGLKPEVATVDYNGVVTALSVGETMVSARAVHPGIDGYCQVRVVDPRVRMLVAVNLTAPVLTLPDGIDQQVTATAVFDDATTTDVTEQAAWSTSNAAIATVSNAPGDRGLVTGASPGAVTVTASFEGVSGGLQLQVTDAVVTGIAVTPATDSVPVGIVRQYAATGTFTDGTSMDLTGSVTWSSTMPGFATVSAAGLATGVAPGATTIAATAGGVTGTAQLTVTNAVLQTIAITPDNPSLPDGLTVQLAAMGGYSSGGPAVDITTQVIWSSNNPTICTVDSAGLATTVGNTAIGACTIVASLDGVQDTTILTVTPAAVTAVAVTCDEATPSPTTTFQCTASATLTDSTVCDVGTTCDASIVATWSATPPDRISCDQSGACSIPQSASPGLAELFAQITPVFVGTARVTVPAPQSVSVTPSTPAPLTQGQIAQFQSFVDFGDVLFEITSVATWSSSDPSVATIDSAGLATGQGVGSTSIAATYHGVTSAPVTLMGVAATAPEISVTSGGAHVTPGFSSLGARITTVNTTRSVIIGNSGTAPLVLGTIAAGATSNCTFVSISQPATTTLAPAALTSFSVVVQPNGWGPFDCELVIPSNDPDEPVFSLTFYGVGSFALGNFDGMDGRWLGGGGCGANDFSLDTDARVFVPSLGVNTNTQFILTASNTASASGLTILGNPNQTCTLSRASATSMTLGCTGTASCSEPLTRAAEPEIKVLQGTSTELLDDMFMDAYQYVTTGMSVPRIYTIANEGTADLTVGTIAIGGPTTTNCSGTITQPGLTTIPAGMSTTFTVSFTVAAQGAFRCDLVIPSNDTTENPFDVQLRGTGL